MERPLSLCNSFVSADFRRDAASARLCIWTKRPRHAPDDFADQIRQALQRQLAALDLKWAVNQWFNISGSREYFVDAAISAACRRRELALFDLLTLLKALYRPVAGGGAAWNDVRVEKILGYKTARAGDRASASVIYAIAMPEGITALLGKGCAAQTLEVQAGEIMWAIWKPFFRSLSEHRSLKFEVREFWKTSTEYGRMENSCAETVHFYTGVKLRLEEWSSARRVVGEAANKIYRGLKALHVSAGLNC